MSKHPQTLHHLAAQAGLDLDEALVLLWDNGFDSLLEPTDTIPKRQVAAAQRVLGITTVSEQLTVAYWQRHSKLDRASFLSVARDAGVIISPNSRKIPRGSLGRMRSLFLVEPHEIEREEPVVSPSTAAPPFEDEIIGTNPPTRFLTLDELMRIHEALEEDFRDSEDPIFPTGVRSEDLLDSALTRAHTSFGDHVKYPTVEMSTAAVVHSIVHNHGFHNGNKRTALVALLVLLDEHHMILTAREADLFKFFLRVSGHNIVPSGLDRYADREVLEIARWVKDNSRQSYRGEYSLKWVKLKQRLRDLGCTFEPASGVGNRLNIRRQIETARRRFRSPRREILTVQVSWAGDGTDADKGVIHKIREELQLTDVHGCDSTAFYRGSGLIIDAFIVEYRQILGRLAKF